MKKQKNIKNKQYTLFTPGPTEVPDFVLQASAQSLVYHREANFSNIYQAVIQQLKAVFKTNGRVFIFTASGTGAMEAAVANLVSRNEKALVAICGKFGERWKELLTRYGAYVRTLDVPYGKTINPQELERKLKTDDTIKYVFTTLTETSTGTLIDIKSFGEICRKLNRLLIVDCIAGLAADEFQMDKWYVDVAIGASQKALFTPPGLSFLACNDKAWQIIEKSRNPRYYFDLLIAAKFHEKNQTPWTPAISIFNGLLSALQYVTKKGIEHSWQRHQTIAEYVRTYLAKLNIELFSEKPSNALTVIKMPEHIDSTKIIEYLKNQYHILFANGQAELKGKIIRIGHMGLYDKKTFAQVLNYFTKVYQKMLKK